MMTACRGPGPGARACNTLEPGPGSGHATQQACQRAAATGRCSLQGEDTVMPPAAHTPWAQMQHGLLPRAWLRALGDCRHRVRGPGTMPVSDHRPDVGGLTGDSSVPTAQSPTPPTAPAQHVLQRLLPTAHQPYQRPLLQACVGAALGGCTKQVLPSPHGSPPLWRVLPASLLSRCAEVEGVTPTTVSGESVDGGNRSGKNGLLWLDVKGTKCTSNASLAVTLHEGGCTTIHVNGDGGGAAV
jgi:hypothetical protein